MRRRPPGPARGLAFGLLTALLCACGDAPVGTPPEGALSLQLPWETVEPASVGFDPGALASAAVRAGEIDRMRSLVVVREGKIALERYWGGTDSETLADVRSVTKSVVSMLVGIALERGEIRSLDQSIGDILRTPRYALSAEQHLITVRHLLTMTGGFEWDESTSTSYNDWILSGDQLDYVLRLPVVDTPGTTFSYNSPAAHLLAVVLEEATGRSLPEYADQVLFGPLGIAERRWEQLSGGGVNGGAGLDLRARDLARLGQLFLQEGWSGTTSIVPAAWVADATLGKVETIVSASPISVASYGFLWWIDFDNTAYFAWGFGGQFVYVVPRLDLVVVATTDWSGVREDIGPDALQEAVLRVIVNQVLPAVR